MSLIPNSRGFNRFFDEASGYWLRSNDQLAVGNTCTEVVNDDKQFGVQLDVSHFKPEELKVRLDGHVLTIEGNHELHDEHSVMQRSFQRKWTLPDDVDIESVRTNLDAQGHLAIQAPKIGRQALRGPRNIPIEHRSGNCDPVSM